ncbi:MAG: dockerin type I repeat-containing protein [Acutalibacteraceae bacterium]|jgi:hypothetical protein
MKTAKRLLAVCLAVLIALPMAIWTVSADDEVTTPPHKVLATILDRGSANANSNGYQVSDNDNHINVTAMDPTITNDDLAVFLNIYIENRDNPDEFHIFEDSQGQVQFVSSIEQNDGVWTYYQTCWNWNKTNPLGLHTGWNSVQLNFATTPKEEGIAANVSNIDITNINNFRVAWWNIANMDEYDHYRIRVADVVLMDTRYEPESEPVYENTEPLVGAWSTLDGNTVYTTTNNYPGGTPVLNTGNHTADGGKIDLTGHDPEKLYLSMDLYIVNKTNPDKVGDYFTSSQIRLSTPGKEGNAYFYSRTHYPDVKTGEWNHLMMPFSTLVNPDRIDWSNLVNFYMYYDSVNHPSEAGDTFEMMVRNVQVIDITNAPVEMELPTLFGDGMIFQQNKPFKVWGKAEAADTVTATLKKGDETVQALDPVTVDENGEWSVTFDALPGGYDAYSIELVNKNAAGEPRSEKVIRDVVFGEVWVAGGQSNMQLSVNDDVNKSAILAEATNHNVRIYLEPTYPVAADGKQPLDPLFSVPGARWGFGDVPTDVVGASSVGYNFIVEMQQKLDMPVGLLNTAVGGSVIEAWVSRETVAADNAYRNFLDDANKYCDAFWWPSQANRQSTLYNAKIGPLAGYNAAGAIWYQGESNRNDIGMYSHALELVQKDWSAVFGWGEEEMPLLYTHIAPYYYGDKTNYSSPYTVLGYFAEEIAKAAADHPDSMGQIAIYDLPLVHWHEDGRSGGAIHPNDKRPVSARLAMIAENLVYGGEGETTAPTFKSMTARDNALYLTFDHVGDGLIISNDALNLQGFTVAGADGIYIPAQAEIVGKDTVKVYSKKLADPQNATYAFTSFNVEGNLAASNGLTAIPFRTDKETVDANLFYDHNWMYADGELWVSGTKEQIRDEADFYDVWATGDAAHSFDAELKSEGKASLKIDYTGTGATAEPQFAAWRNMNAPQFANFSCLSVDLQNPDARTKTVKLALVSGGKTYYSAQTATLAANSDFASYDFSLTQLDNADGTPFTANAADILAAATALRFEVSDTAAGTVRLDNVRFATSMDDVVIGGGLLGDVDQNGIVTAADALMALQAATGKITLTDAQAAVADVDGQSGVTAADALLILQFATGKITAF